MTDFEKNVYDKEIMLALQNKGVKSIINNNDVEHARILTQRLIQSAESEIIILCHRLAWQVYGCDDIASALRDAYNRNPKLKCHIYIRNKVPDYTSFYATLMAHGVRLQQNFISDLPDLIIVDSANGREEVDTEKKQGRAHFHDESWAQKMRRQLLAA